MQIETTGPYQLHLIAHEVAANQWDPFVSVFRFDNEAQDFQCVVEKRHAAAEPLPTYEEAIEAARQVGNALLHRGNA